MSTEELKDETKAAGGCCGGSGAPAAHAKAHAHAHAPGTSHGHHHHDHAHGAHAGKTAAASGSTEAKETSGAECCATGEAEKAEAVKVEQKADGGGCCSR